MALRLRVTGPRAAVLGERATRVFGVHGGRIGRAGDNEWVLPDPERFLSGHHATIEHRGGQWYVVDTSSNGTFLNLANTALGRDNAQPLRDGDRLRMGGYDMLVTVTQENDFPPDDDSVAALDLATEADFALATHGDLGAELDLKRLIADPTPPPDDSPPAPAKPIRAVDAYGQVIPVQSVATPGVRAAGRSAAGGHAPAVLAFFRGTGLDPAPLSVEQANAALALAGQLLREMVLGLMTNQQTRVESKGRYRIDDTSITRAEQNPLKAATSVDDAITRLFGPRSTRFLLPLEAVRQSFNELKRHDQATQIALQDAIADYLRRLAPEQLEQQFAEALSRSGPLTAEPGQKYWEMYAEIYRVLAQTSPEGLPHAFAEEFARAYATAIAELAEQDRRPVSTGRRAP
ncbi:MAG TPA: type VI secretion system-associated FHA domain protein TagH [Steroidobacteraceae bacterium]|nr:type VI secretion system-associated FHA domain protein TagH [Steroidobacteraceae bacterium]